MTKLDPNSLGAFIAWGAATLVCFAFISSLHFVLVAGLVPELTDFQRTATVSGAYEIHRGSRGNISTTIAGVPVHCKSVSFFGVEPCEPGINVASGTSITARVALLRCLVGQTYIVMWAESGGRVVWHRSAQELVEEWTQNSRYLTNAQAYFLYALSIGGVLVAAFAIDWRRRGNAV